MGKAQSKRSVDITTEAKKTPDEEVPGKLEKIEDIDQKQVNGDASSQEKPETEKKDGNETENEKDLTTEKNGSESGKQDGGGDTNKGQCNAIAVESASKEDDSSAAKDYKPVEDVSPLAEENNKKLKKEKVKKKWSFRSISFGKKDKQKPTKTEEASEDPVATNGDAAAEAGEGAVTDEISNKNEKDEAVGDAEGLKSNVKLSENGDASEKEMNGEKVSATPTPTEDQPAKEVTSNENTTNITNNTAEVTSSATPETIISTAISSENKTANTATTITSEIPKSSPAAVSNGDTIVKNGSDTLFTVDEQVTDKAVHLIEEIADVAEKVNSIPKVASEVSDNNGVHQNGLSVNGEEEIDTENESKSHVEVIFQTNQGAHTDDLVTLITSSSPKITPISIPDPKNTDSTKISDNSSENVISNSNDTEKNEDAAISAQNPESILTNATPQAIELASTSTSSDTKSIDVGDIATGNEGPSEPELDSHQICRGENMNEDLTPAINEKTTTKIETETPKPPSLPVSPPPSKVSIFAFNDHNRANEEQEEAICSTYHHDIVTDIETPSPPAYITPHSDNQLIPDLKSCTNERTEDTKGETHSTTSDIISTNFEKRTENITTDAIDENHENELVKVATSVVDEISEKAVEHIHLQKKEKLEKINDIRTTIDVDDNLKTDDNITTDIINHIDDIVANTAKCSPTDEVINEMESLNISCDNTSVKQNDTLSNAESQNLADCIKFTDKHMVEIHGEKEIPADTCSENVDITNATDLKECAAADIATQDLPVICE